FLLSSRRRHTRSKRDWSSDVCSSDLLQLEEDDGDGLVHPGGQGLVLLSVVVGVVPGEFGLEAGAVAVPVDLVGEEGQGAQGDAEIGRASCRARGCGGAGGGAIGQRRY